MIALPFIVNCLLNFAMGILLAKLLGPAEYGRYALAMSIALVLQTLALDWLRHSTIRFYSERDRTDHPEIRATLDLIFVVIIGIAALATLAISISGIQMPIATALVVLSILTAVAIGLFEISAAVLRARFMHKAYGVFILTKNGLSILLTAGAAWYTGSAQAALIGLIVSVVGSCAICAKSLIDRKSHFSSADRSLTRRFATYGFPIVIASVFYQAIPMTNRGLVSQVHDFAQAGQLALAYDIGVRIFGSIGAALDVLLFQIAVAAEREHGSDAARFQLSRNMGIIIFVLAPTILGCWLVLPSFEALIIPLEFRGPFARYFTLMLPGMACYALIAYCLIPVFQIAHRTTPLIFAGAAALMANGITIALLPKSIDASTFALAQTASSAVGLIALTIFLMYRQPVWPPMRDMIVTTIGLIFLTAVAFPLRWMAPSIGTLMLQVSLGCVAYGSITLSLDVCGLKGLVLARFNSFRTRRGAALTSA